MSAVTPLLQKIILELQDFSSIESFALAGGTNLAIRYQHRVSIDIDFISPNIVGKEGFENIIFELQKSYGEKSVRAILMNEDLGNQFMFLRVFLTVSGEILKIEFLQNMKCLYAFDIFESFRLVHLIDIGLFKLLSATKRFSKKDIYDLDFITDEINLIELFRYLEEKQTLYYLPEHRSLFDLDISKNLIDCPEMLLEFDEIKKTKTFHTSHTHDRIDIFKHNKSWSEARIHWRQKVRQLFRNLNKPFPTLK